jgi:Zn-dependent protease with chaperone function
MLGYIRTNGVRLNQDQFPQVYEKDKGLCAKMDMKFVPDVYVLESSEALNAFATRFFGSNMVVLYSTIFEMIEEGAEEELSFVKQVNRTSYLNQVNEEKGFVIWLSEVLSSHPPLPKRINEIGLFWEMLRIHW